MVTAAICGELESFFGKFINLSHHGFNATLALKCNDGNIDVNLSATFGTNANEHATNSVGNTETRYSKLSQMRRRILRREAKKNSNFEKEATDDVSDIPATEEAAQNSVNLNNILSSTDIKEINIDVSKILAPNDEDSFCQAQC